MISVNPEKLEEIVDKGNKPSIELTCDMLEQCETLSEFKDKYFQGLREIFGGFGASIDQTIHPMFLVIYQNNPRVKESSISEMHQAYKGLNEVDLDNYFAQMAHTPHMFTNIRFVGRGKLDKKQVDEFVDKGRNLMYQKIREYVSSKSSS